MAYFDDENENTDDYEAPTLDTPAVPVSKGEAPYTVADPYEFFNKGSLEKKMQPKAAGNAPYTVADPYEYFKTEQAESAQDAPTGTLERTLGQITPTTRQQPEPESKPGIFGAGRDVLNALAAGSLDLAQMGARSVRAFDPPGGTDVVRDITTPIIEKTEELAGDFGPSKEAAEGGAASPRRAIYEGVRSMVPSVGGGLVGSIASGNPITGFALGAGGLFAASEYDRFIDEGMKQGKAYSELMPYALASGAVEGGGEALADVIGAKFLGIGKEPFKATVKAMLHKPITEIAKGMLKQMPVEIGTEMGQESGEAWLRNKAGVGDDDPLNQALSVIGPTMVMTLLMGAGGSLYDARRRASIENSLVNPEVAPEKREAAAFEIAAGIAGDKKAPDFKEKQQLAKDWLETVDPYIQTGSPIPIDTDTADFVAESIKNRPPAPIVPEQTAEDMADEILTRPPEGATPAAAPAQKGPAQTMADEILGTNILVQPNAQALTTFTPEQMTLQGRMDALSKRPIAEPEQAPEPGTVAPSPELQQFAGQLSQARQDREETDRYKGESLFDKFQRNMKQAEAPQASVSPPIDRTALPQAGQPITREKRADELQAVDFEQIIAGAQSPELVALAKRSQTLAEKLDSMKTSSNPRAPIITKDLTAALQQNNQKLLKALPPGMIPLAQPMPAENTAALSASMKQKEPIPMGPVAEKIAAAEAQVKSGPANGVAEISQPVGDGVLAHSKLFGDSSDAKAVVSKGFESIDRDGQHVVLSQVLRSLDNDQIFRAVVEAVPVDVMDSLIGGKGSSKDILNDKAVLSHRLTIPRNIPVGESVVRFVNTLSAKIKGITAGNAAEEPSLTTARGSGGNGEAPTASGTSKEPVGSEGALTGLGTEKLLLPAFSSPPVSAEGGSAGVANKSIHALNNGIEAGKKQAAPQEVRAHKKGETVGLMGKQAVVSEAKVIDGVSYEFYYDNELKSTKGFVRIFDVDSGQTVGITQYPNLTKAKAAYLEAVKRAQAPVEVKTPEKKQASEPAAAPTAQPFTAKQIGKKTISYLLQGDRAELDKALAAAGVKLYPENKGKSKEPQWKYVAWNTAQGGYAFPMKRKAEIDAFLEGKQQTTGKPGPFEVIAQSRGVKEAAAERDAFAKQAIKTAADSIEKLRRPDVFRVLNENKDRLDEVARYIYANRPDLRAEVDSQVVYIKDTMQAQAPSLPGTVPGKVEEPTAPAAKDLTGMSLSDLVKDMAKAINDHIGEKGNAPMLIGKGEEKTQSLSESLYQVIKPYLIEMVRRAKEYIAKKGRGDIETYVNGAVDAMEEGQAKQAFYKAADRYFSEDDAEVKKAEQYFKMEHKAFTLRLDDLILDEKKQPESVKRALAYMERAASGEGKKRGPILVKKMDGGKYYVVDGQATVAALRELGGTYVVAREKIYEKIGENEFKKVRDLIDFSETKLDKFDAIVKKVIKDADIDTSKPGNFISGLKSNKSILDKVNRKRRSGKGYELEQLKDHVRGAIFVNDYTEMPAVLRALHDAGFEIENMLGNLGSMESWGYGGVHSSIPLGDGINGEIQIHTREGWAIKEKSDVIYADWRNMLPEDIANLADAEKQKYFDDQGTSIKMWDDYAAAIPSGHLEAISDAVSNLPGRMSSSLTPSGSTSLPEGSTMRQSEPNILSTLPDSNSTNRGALGSNAITQPPLNSIENNTDDVKGKKEQPQKALQEKKIADFVKDKILSGEAFKLGDLYEAANEAYGGKRTEGKYTPKDAADAMELGINMALEAKKFSPAVDMAEAMATIDRIRAEIMDVIPSQGNTRTAEQDEFQQFSTPPELSYVMNWVAGIKPGDSYVEPSGGIGGLAIYGKVAGASVVVNELSVRRANMLEHLGFDAVYRENAEQLANIHPDIKADVVVTNPPFSATAGRMKGQRSSSNVLIHLNQDMQMLKPGGRLVALIGKGWFADPKKVSDWFNKISKEYQLRAIIEVDGKGYAKYGTTYDNRIIVIDKVANNPAIETVREKVSNAKDAIPLLEGIRNDRINESEAVKPGSKEVAAENAMGSVSGLSELSQPDVLGDGERGNGQDNAGMDASGSSATSGQPGPRGGVSVSTPGGRPGAGTKADGKPVSGAAPAGKKPGRGSKGTTGASKQPVSSGQQGVEPSPGSAEPAAKPVYLGAVEQSKTEQKNEAPLTDSVYESYTPQKLKIPGAKPHPAKLVQSAAMASVQPPNPTYTPKLSKDLIEKGGISLVGLEAVVYAGQAHEQMLPNGERRGFFIGDGTGVGKGREISCIITDNMNRGRTKALWLSKSAKLINDARRDFEDIGQNPNKVFELNKTKIGQPVTDKDGVMFLTYSTLGSGLSADRGGNISEKQEKGGKSRLSQIVDWLGPDFDGVIAFDEAHAMQNSQAEKGKMGLKKPSVQGLAGIELQKRLPNARIVYVSATGATRVQGLGYAERLGLWGEGTAFPNKASFVNSIQSGGLAAMEVVARDMKAMGAYIARNLDYSDVTHSTMAHNLSDDQKEVYNTLARAWQTVLENIDAALEETNQAKDGMAKGSAKSKFWGANQRFFNQVITSMQMPSVLADVKKQIAEGNSVVMQLVNTLEAVQNRKIAQKDATEELEELDLTPREILMDYISKAFPVAEWETYIDDEGNERARPVVDSNGNAVFNAAAVKMREDLLDKLGSIKVPDGPLEYIINTFGPQNVAEITGRSKRVVKTMVDGQMKTVIEKRGKNATTTEADEFQSGKRRILVFSDAGGTGRSFHADKTKKNQQKRIHYLVQPGWRADNAVQGFGRTHRTNQAQAPHFVMVTTDLKGQKRFISSIARRLDELGALTKGQRQTGSQGMFSASDNLQSRYAEDALENFIYGMYHGDIPGMDFHDITKKLGLDLLDQNGGINENKMPDMPKFLNRLLSLEYDDQNMVFDAFQHIHENNIEAAITSGEYETGLENFKADKINKTDERTVYTQPGSGAETQYLKFETQHKAHKVSFTKAVEAKNFIGFFKNNNSGKVWAAYNAGVKTDDSGRVHTMVRLLGQLESSVQHVEEGRLEEKRWVKDDYVQNWNKIEKADAKPLWNEALASSPDYVKNTMHMISGAILPIWDRLEQGGKHRVLRVQTDGGQRFIGRIIPESSINTVLRNLGADAANLDYSPDRCLKSMKENAATVSLVNNWSMRQSQVQGEPRIEIKGPDYRSETELERAGVIKERINYTTRYFLPSGEGAIEAFKNIVKTKPVVDISETVPGARFNVATPGTRYGIAPASQLEEELQPLTDHFKKSLGLTVRVVDTAAQIPFAAPKGANGAVLGDTVYLVADSITSTDEAVGIMIGEALHRGLDFVDAKTRESFFNYLPKYKDAGPRIDAIIRNRQAAGQRMSPRQAAEEYFVHQLGTNKDLQRLSWWKELAAIVRAWVRKNFPQLAAKMKLTDADIAMMVKKAMTALHSRDNGQARPGTLQPSPAFSQAQTKTEAFKKLSDFIGSPSLARGVMAAIDKATIDSLKRNAKVVSDFLESGAIISHSNGNINIPTNVIFHVFEMAHDPQVRQAIVRLLPIDVVDFLKRKKFSPDRLLNDKSMLKNVFSVDAKSSISPYVDISIAKSLLRSIANTATEISRLAGGALESYAAKTANTSDSVFRAHVQYDSINRQERQANFAKWFAGSKVVDENGKPMVVYHGTSRNGAIKSKDLKGKRDKGGISVFDTTVGEMGTHFGTIDQANMLGNGKGSHLYPSFLSIKNPLRLEDRGDFESNNVASQLIDLGLLTEAEHEKIWRNVTTKRGEITAIQDVIKNAGYDGIVYLNRREGVDSMGPDGFDGDEINEMPDDFFREQFPEAQDSWIAFSPTQIKSETGNVGSFDASNPDIRYSVGDRFRDHDLPMDNVKPKLMDITGKPREIYDRAEAIFYSWPEVVTSADGKKVKMQVPYFGTLEKRVAHFMVDSELGIFHPDKARWIPNVVDTLENAAARIKDDETHNDIYVRMYADGTKHMVVVDPTGRISGTGLFQGDMTTQFPYLPRRGKDKQGRFIVEWERGDKNVTRRLPGTPSPAPIASNGPGTLTTDIPSKSIASASGKIKPQDVGGKARFFVQGDIAAKSPGQQAKQPQANQRSQQFMDLPADAQKALREVGGIVDKVPLKTRLRELLKDSGKKLHQGIIDQFAPLKDLNPKAYMLARLSKGYEGAVEALLTFGNLRLLNGVYDSDAKGVGLIDTMKKLRGEVDRFFWWVAANRAEQLKAEGRENLFSDESIEALKKLNQGDKAFADRAQVYAEVFKEYVRVNKNVLDMAEQSNLISAEARQVWEHEFYLPFFRDKEDAKEGVNLTKKGLVRQKAIERLKGGTDKLNQDLLFNVLQNWSHLIQASANNRAAEAALKSAEEMGAATSLNEEGEPLTAHEKSDVWAMGWQERTIPEGEEYEEKGETKISDGTAKVLEHGKIYYRVSDPYVLAALTALDSVQIGGPAVEVMAKFKKALTYGVTINPAFRIRNLLRDSIAAMAVSGLGYNPVKNIGQGIKALENRKSQDYASLLASGGLIRFGAMLDGASSGHVMRLIKKGVKPDTIITGGWDQLKNLYEKYQDIGDLSEGANRAALYKQLIAQGMSHGEAALAARDLLDFSKGGTFQAVRFLTTVVPFLNARIQGLYKLGQGAKEDPRKFATVAGAVALASIALAAAYADDDDWKKREDWDRDNYWWFKMGGVAFRLPKPFEVGAIGTLAERSFEYITSPEMTGKRYRDRMKNMFSQTFAFNPVPQMFKPIMDVYSNIDSFTGRPIEKMGMERLQKSQRYDSKTSEVAKFLGLAGDYTGLSPVQVDQVMKGYLGWLGTMVNTMVDYGVRPVSGGTERPSMALRDVFLAGNFVETLPSGSSRYVTQFYQQAKEIEEAYATYKDMVKKGDVQDAAEFMEENRDKIGQYHQVNKVRADMSDINQRIRKIETSRLSGSDKREMIDNLRRRYNLTAQQISTARTRIL